ncbi:uncharacterized protein LOC113661823 [Tachysurus fulvidraco]|uniref:uncharacterized protein LOC113661823 n=1 Tax=Tachysurus fulvidraco TaxID=1234273 RepID=UPI000F4E1AE5|nr:uncharacterized protein LOC113661823 [Tachysurus fulvidraco]XP_047658604.1 uncharacterized protein LOC113661823 [Tachysurus fulvidraco]
MVLNKYIPPIVYLLVLQCQAFTVREILVNEPVTFICTCAGNHSEVRWTRFIPSNDIIAACHNQICLIEQHWLTRFAISGNMSRGNFSMRISSVVYNDAGSYRCTCDKVLVTEVKLKVYVPTVIIAKEGETATLPCYGLTHQRVNDVKWKKAGQQFLLYTHENRSMTIEKALADRYMMSMEVFLDGDLSIHINSVQQSDTGFYQCLIHDESQEGEPRALLMKVERLQHLPTTCNGTLLGLLVFVVFAQVTWVVIKKHQVCHTTAS